MKPPYNYPQEVWINDMQCTCSCKKSQEIKPINGNELLAGIGVGIIVFIFVVSIIRNLGQGSKHTMKYLRDKYGRK